MKAKLEISNKNISLSDIFQYFQKDFEISLGESTVSAIKNCRSYLMQRLEESDAPIYGINTGFGSLCDVKIEKSQIEELQEKLILSHACGTGDEVPVEIARLILLLKIKNLSFGYSGVSLKLVETMIAHYNAEVTPVIYQLGSLGASGDLAPLSHMSLQLLGLGQVHYKGVKRDSKAVIDDLGISPMRLSAKEGLALINGTQFSLSYGLYAAYHSQRLMRFANLIAAMSLDAYNCMPDPFFKLLQNIRSQTGQMAVAESIRAYRDGSQILSAPKHNVQDPYSFRCIPQVHGASYDAIQYVSKIVERELNSVTDNPNIFPDEDEILSGGNFHAQALALPLDFLAIALSELSDISERRIFKLINGDRDLPQFLTPNPGLNSGFMIIQYTAASVVNQNKHLANPVSTDSIVSSKGQEDHVSMAANSATKIYRLIDNVYRVMAMELMCAAQALDFRGVDRSSKTIQDFHASFRMEVKSLEEDREQYLDIESSVQFMKSYPI